MASRGRGKGKPLISLGGDQGNFGKTEVAPPILQPPPSYLPLEYKPLPTTISNELRYLLQLKKDFAEYMHESPNNVLPIVIKKDIERYSDRYQDLLSMKQQYESRYDWTRMPIELKRKPKKRKGFKQKELVKKKIRDIDIESKLQELEKKETIHHSDAEEDEKDDDELDEKDVEDKIDNEEEEVDEEMDEGTDYVNNYFDNGENYEDDEENLDDGAIF
ncbi:PREDICTED: DNA-directed RNA polymerase III subunit RPC7-like [Ceratosolen solmsi marchali]|uniref:DNA-directed RNA polymerase III subunit RPC7-like n=1 Tax=Ceratosolen solmsi marchali TaxID=326594 RepID=A0AAJ6YRY5_9HYME|nr:PREDICTED: DNA-directed RNA polymerase III subunit RPC7-like [Ceratosolen solmsi marchali]